MNQNINEAKIVRLSLKQKLFCKYYIENFGNGTEAVVKAGYVLNKKDGSINRNLAKSIASENLAKPDILTYLNNLLEKVGLNDETVSTQLLFLINQHLDLSVKARAIDIYYKRYGKYAPDKLDVNSQKLEEALDRMAAILPSAKD